jgi:hypothetical protein
MSRADWFDADVSVQAPYAHRMSAYGRAREILLALGNTGAAVHRRWNAQTMTSRNIPGVDMAPLQRLVPATLSVRALTQLRHPDPARVAQLEVQEPALQVRGSWAKLAVKRAPEMRPRVGPATWLWEGACAPPVAANDR